MFLDIKIEGQSFQIEPDWFISVVIYNPNYSFCCFAVCFLSNPWKSASSELFASFKLLGTKLLILGLVLESHLAYQSSRASGNWVHRVSYSKIRSPEIASKFILWNTRLISEEKL
ncbi:hypothetical protein QTP88_025748 [Uroleucon formosanum]